MIRRSIPIIVSFLLAFAVTAVLFSIMPEREAEFFFEVSVASQTPGVIQLFYDDGSGCREDNSVRLPLLTGNHPYRFPLPSGVYSQLRLDPIDRPGAVTVSAVRIEDSGGRVVWQFSLDARNAVHDVTSVTQRGPAIELLTGPDPNLVIPLDHPLKLAPAVLSLHRVRPFAPVFVVVFGLGLLGHLPPARRFFSRSLSKANDQATGSGLALPPSAPRPWVLTVMVMLTAFKLWLVSGQTIVVRGVLMHDDRHFINLTHHLLQGDWLGKYDQYTLIKGPMYSLFMAAVFLLGIPLLTAQHLVHAAGCWVLDRAMGPFLVRSWLRIALFAALLFNPATYATDTQNLILRQNILPGLILLVIAGFVALYARAPVSNARMLPWAFLAGGALPAFWLTREEGVWLLPFVALLSVAAAITCWRLPTSVRFGRMLILVLPFLLWGAGLGAVALVNLHYYGEFTTCEFKHPSFTTAYGAMLRVEPATAIPYVPVTREMRERIYATCPTFAELRPYLDGPSGEGWARESENFTHIPAVEHEIGMGFFMWALRDAVAQAGHCSSGREAMSFYARMAREINDACDRGLLRAGPRHTGLVPPLSKEFPRLRVWFFPKLRGAASLVCGFKDLTTEPQSSFGSPEDISLFTDIIRSRISPTADGLYRIPPEQRWLDGVRIRLLQRVLEVYRWASPYCGWSALVALIVATGVALRRRRRLFFCVVSAGALGSTLVLLSICTLIDITSFPAITPEKLAGAYGLWILFIPTAFMALLESLGPAEKPSEQPAPLPTGP